MILLSEFLYYQTMIQFSHLLKTENSITKSIYFYIEDL